MLVITCTCSTPMCSGRIQFRSSRPLSVRGQFSGACDHCGALYTLEGGEIRLLRPGQAAAS